MEPVNESVGFVEFVTQAGHPAPGNQGSMALRASRSAFGRFHFLRDFVDVRVQGLQ